MEVATTSSIPAGFLLMLLQILARLTTPTLHFLAVSMLLTLMSLSKGVA